MIAPLSKSLPMPNNFTAYDQYVTGLEPGVTAVNRGSHGHGHGRDRGQFILKVRDRD